MVAHTYNPSTMEVETESDMAGQREEYKAGRDRNSDLFTLRIHRDRLLLLQSEDFIEVRALVAAVLLL